MATPRADPARQRGAGKGPSPARRSPPPERQAAHGVSPEGGELREEERSMPHFIKVATADELADQRQWLLCPERHLHPSKGTVVGRDGRGSRSDLSVARGEVRRQDRGGSGAARRAGR